MSRMIDMYEAAKLLGCTHQTISNWLHNGILQGHKVGRKTMIDSATIKKFFDEAEDAALTGERIAALQKEQTELEKELQQQVNSLRNAVCGLHGLTATLRKEVVSALARVYLPSSSDRNQWLVEHLFQGDSIKTIAERFGVTSERIVQIFRKMVKRMMTAKPYCDLLSENSDLQAKLAEANVRIAQLEKLVASNAAPSEDDTPVSPQELDEAAKYMYSLLSTRVTDLDLSTRALNCLRSEEIETLGDLVQFTGEELSRIRNFGRQSLAEITAMLYNKGLEFGMNTTKYGYPKFKKPEHITYRYRRY